MRHSLGRGFMKTKIKSIFQTLFLIISLIIMLWLAVKGTMDVFGSLVGDDHLIRGFLLLGIDMIYSNAVWNISKDWENSNLKIFQNA